VPCPSPPSSSGATGGEVERVVGEIHLLPLFLPQQALCYFLRGRPGGARHRWSPVGSVRLANETPLARMPTSEVMINTSDQLPSVWGSTVVGGRVQQPSSLQHSPSHPGQLCAPPTRWDNQSQLLFLFEKTADSEPPLSILSSIDLGVRYREKYEARLCPGLAEELPYPSL